MATKDKKNSLAVKGWTEDPLYFFDPTWFRFVSENTKKNPPQNQIQFAKTGSMRKLFTPFFSLVEIEGFGVYIMVREQDA